MVTGTEADVGSAAAAHDYAVAVAAVRDFVVAVVAVIVGAVGLVVVALDLILSPIPSSAWEAA